MKPLLVVVAGPTAVGKTALSVQLAETFNCSVISADSRQFYKEMKIGTARPSDRELNNVQHFFLGHLSVADYYNVSQFEQDVNKLFTEKIIKTPVCILTGGSGLYIQAVCNGIAEMPDVDPEIRQNLMSEVEKNGIEHLRMTLENIDPTAYSQIDKNNKNRMLRAVEMNLMTGKNLSEIYAAKSSEKPFRILKIAINRPREELYQRINLRVDQMMTEGLLEEAKSLLPVRHHNSLNTVGYKELFKFFDGEDSLEGAVEKIKNATRRYARRQLTWFRADKDYHWYEPGDFSKISQLITDSQ